MRSFKIYLSLFLTFGILSCSEKNQNLELKNENKITLETPYTLDVSNFEFKEPRDIPGMVSTSSEGEEVKVNSAYITKGQEPWIPSYGEFHYSRMPETEWEDAILKMKSQGFYGISTYVFWIHHEEIEGQWDFTGRRNLRKFIELCKKHNMGVFMRIGPWANGECRNGGHPDWLVKRLGDPEHPFAHAGCGGRLRTPDPEYVAAFDKLYYQLSKQIEGLYWKDGGPIFAIQLDNELTPYHAGPEGKELLRKEKEIALKYGMEVPLYTTTGWNGAEFNQDETIPVHGSYGDYYWGYAKDYYRTPAYSFSRMRAVDDIDTNVNPVESENIYNIEEYNNNPYLSCETGIGIHLAYHRRPKITAADNAAISLVELGSGCNGMGYFMNLGGQNFKGKLTYLNRELSQGTPENPVFSNDFQSAIGEFGQIRDSYYEYPLQLNFMKDFGKYLAPCTTFIPEATDELQGKDLLNSKVLQHALRTDGDQAFVFVNNHIKHDTLMAFDNVQFELKLKEETVLIPEQPVNIPIGSYFYWPVNLELSDIKLKQASAQPILHLEGSDTYVFFQNQSIDAHFIFENKNIDKITASDAELINSGDYSRVKITNAGLHCMITISKKDGKQTKFIVLNETQAKQLYRNEDTLYLSDAEVLLFDTEVLQVISPKTKNTIWMYPESNLEGVEVTKEGVFEKVSVSFDQVDVPFEYKKTQEGRDIVFENKKWMFDDNNPIIGAPNDSVFDKGTILELGFPEGIPNDLYDVRVRIDYVAPALRFYKDDIFTYDSYYNETAWVLSSRHLLQDYNSDMKLELKFVPFQPNDPIYFNGKYWPDLKKNTNVLEVNSLEVIPIYQASLGFN